MLPEVRDGMRDWKLGRVSGHHGRPGDLEVGGHPSRGVLVQSLAHWARTVLARCQVDVREPGDGWGAAARTGLCTRSFGGHHGPSLPGTLAMRPGTPNLGQSRPAAGVGDLV